MADAGAVRRWWSRRRKPDAAADSDDFEPMDSQEQEELVQSLERKHTAQSQLWRRVFAGFLVGYALFMAYSAFFHAPSPLEVRYYAYFADDMKSPTIILADWLSILACMLAVKGLLSSTSSSKQWMWYSSYAAFAVAFIWIYYMLRLPHMRFDVIWLPLTPLCGAGVSLYVDHIFRESLEDIGKLRSYMYSYKTL